jgi:hypothetical protein
MHGSASLRLKAAAAPDNWKKNRRIIRSDSQIGDNAHVWLPVTVTVMLINRISFAPVLIFLWL